MSNTPDNPDFTVIISEGDESITSQLVSDNLSIDIPSDTISESPAPLDFTLPGDTLRTVWMGEIPGNVSNLLTLEIPNSTGDLPLNTGTASTLGMVGNLSVTKELVIPDNMTEDGCNKGIYIEQTSTGFSIFKLVDGELKKLTPKNYSEKPRFNKSGIATISNESGTTFVKLIGDELREFHSENSLSSKGNDGWMKNTVLYVLKADSGRALVFVGDNGIHNLTEYEYHYIHTGSYPGYMLLNGDKSCFAKKTGNTIHFTPLKNGQVSIYKSRGHALTMKYKVSKLGNKKNINDAFADQGIDRSVSLNDVLLLEHDEGWLFGIEDHSNSLKDSNE